MAASGGATTPTAINVERLDTKMTIGDEINFFQQVVGAPGMAKDTAETRWRETQRQATAGDINRHMTAPLQRGLDSRDNKQAGDRHTTAMHNDHNLSKLQAIGRDQEMWVNLPRLISATPGEDADLSTWVCWHTGVATRLGYIWCPQWMQDSTA